MGISTQLIRPILKLAAASMLSLAVGYCVNSIFKKIGIDVQVPGFVMFLITCSILLFFGKLMRSVIIPVAVFLLYCCLVFTGCYGLARHFKMDWFLQNSTLQWVAMSLIASVPILIKLYFYAKNYFSQKTLEEIDKLGDGDAKKGGFLFEEYIAQLYRKLGYNAKTVAQLKKEGKVKTKGFDQGADVVVDFIEKGEVYRAVIQCKLYSAPVGNKAVQEALASMPLYNAQFAIVLTNNTFTEAAIELANANGVRLISRDGLAALLERAKNPKLNDISQKLAA